VSGQNNSTFFKTKRRGIIFMTTQPGANVYTQSFGSSDLSVAFPVYLYSAPSSTYGVNHPIGKRAIVQSTNEEYVLTSKSSANGTTSATWKPWTTSTSGTSAAMVAGTVTVDTTAVTVSSVILVYAATPGGTQGTLSIGTITAGTSFVINSSSSTDTSTVNYLIIG
jgi:hypothetical protein